MHIVPWQLRFFKTSINIITAWLSMSRTTNGLRKARFDLNFTHGLVSCTTWRNATIACEEFLSPMEKVSRWILLETFKQIHLAQFTSKNYNSLKNTEQSIIKMCSTFILYITITVPSQWFQSLLLDHKNLRPAYNEISNQIWMNHPIWHNFLNEKQMEK